MNFKHTTVMIDETIKYLNINPSGVYLDATLGAGGLSERILKNLGPDGILISIDMDIDSINFCKNKFKNENRIKIYHSNFVFLDEILENENINKVDGICMDLGVSSYQIDCAERGFSYIHDGKLDMRMGQNGISAYDVVNFYDENKLADIILKYGEEKNYKRISRAICEFRKKKRIETTLELVNIVEKVVPKFKSGHSAKKTFQAIRIEVNNELNNLDIALDKCVNLLRLGGRLVVLSFHSLEDRIVKTKMKYWEKSCVCPPEFPICKCSKIKQVKLINKQIITASTSEIEKNSRSKSAKLRVCEKI